MINFTNKKENQDKNRLLLMMTGFSCNNNCIICSLKPQAIIHNNKTTKEIESVLEKAVQDGFSRVEFTGGEPTLRKDLLHLVRYAKNLGFEEIAISTNGRLLSYRDFLDKLVGAGLNRATLTLYSCEQTIHESITRTPGSFKQTINGIYNVLQQPGIKVSVNTVVCRLNYKLLCETGMFLKKIGLNVWSISDLIPFGNAEQFYSTLAVEVKELSVALNKLLAIIDNFQLIEFFDFSTCLFSEKLRNHKQATFFDARGRVNNFNQVGYNPKRFDLEKGGIYNDIHKRRMVICKKCFFVKNCAGIWNNYLNIYGQRDVYNLAKENGCLGFKKQKEDFFIP